MLRGVRLGLWSYLDVSNLATAGWPGVASAVVAQYLRMSNFGRVKKLRTRTGRTAKGAWACEVKVVRSEGAGGR